MARGLIEEYLLPLFVGSIINYTYSNVTEIAQWSTLIIAVDHNHLRTITSVTVDLYTGRYPYRLQGSTPKASSNIFGN